MYILYSSRNGTTKRYAELMAKATDLPCTDDPQAIPPGDRVLLFGWVKAGKIQGYRRAFRQFDLQAVVAVGLEPSGTQEALLRKRNAMRDTTKLFTLQGGYYPDTYKGLEKKIMAMIAKTLLKETEQNPQPTSAETELAEILQKGGHRASEEKLNEILEWYHN